ncbi:TPA: transcription elongation factor GreA [Candidatus Dojkabacteria bacterium]|uniref:Transcription elongation factor GreA n=1 Tax=Candidatus Dojkabacteria bacterium TaxID=2099670 RepID=A0A832QGX3_9BACT|nr:GreA/GreB family elongation factor [Candidatus Dojkabacteria bacterium]HHX99207.1 transcription elongation factor GreA [Candidatus Dojkabacteria bacterium]
MSDNNEYLTTKEGLEKLKEELKERETVTREKIANVLNEMRSQGDLSENDGYSMAVEEQNINEAKIVELKEKIKNAKVVVSTKKNVVHIGDTVLLKGKKELKYQIVGEDQANPLEGKISHLSPVGESLIGKKIGDKIELPSLGGKEKYVLSEIL